MIRPLSEHVKDRVRGCYFLEILGRFVTVNEFLYIYTETHKDLRRVTRIYRF